MTTAHNLTLGQGVRLLDDRFWWTVRAIDERYAILTRPSPFRSDGVLTYTILDAETGRRGPCNLIGQGWDFDPFDPEVGALELLTDLVSGDVEISHRNNVQTIITKRRTS